MKRLLLILLAALAITAKAQEKVDIDSIYADFVDMEIREDYDSAYTILKQGYALDPEAAEVNFQVALYERMFAMRETANKVQDFMPPVIEKLKKAYDKEPSSKKYARTLLNAYAQMEDSVNILPMLERIVELDRTNEQYMLLLLRMYDNRGEYDKELELLQRLETISGITTETELTRVDIFKSRDGDKKALKYLNELLKKHPNVTEYRIFLAQHYAEKGNFKKALPEYDRALELNPADVNSRYSYIICLEKMGKNEEARQMKLDIVYDPKASSELKVQLLRDILEELEADSTAAQRMTEIFRKALEQPQENTDMTYLFAGYLKMHNCSEDSVVQIMKEILEKEPTNEYAYKYMLSHYAAQDNKEKVVSVCKQALRNGVNQLELYYYQGAYCYQIDNIREALRILKEGVSYRQFANNPNLYADCYGLIGDIYHKLDSMPAAYAAYDECLRWNPDNIMVLNNYAYFLSLEGKDLEKAERMAKKVVLAEPNRGIYLDTYAWILYMMGRYKEAAEYINRAISDTGNVSYDVYDHAGDIYFMMGETGAAVAYWELARDKAKEEGVDTAPFEKKIKTKKLQ